jgi:hypothetical protein
MMALWELPWNRLQKPLACPANSLKTLGGVLNPVSFSRQFPKSQKIQHDVADVPLARLPSEQLAANKSSEFVTKIV